MNQKPKNKCRQCKHWDAESKFGYYGTCLSYHNVMALLHCNHPACKGFELKEQYNGDKKE